MLKTYLFALIVGIQAIFGLNATVGQIDNGPEIPSRPVAAIDDRVVTTVQANKQPDYLQKLKDMGMKLHPGSSFAPDNVENPVQLKHCASLVYRTLSVMPPETVGQVKNLTLYFNSTGRRGLGGGSTIILRCQDVTDEELVSVLVHELGHIADTGVLTGNAESEKSEFMDGENHVYENDPSLPFYRISFQNEANLKSSSTPDDFVSGYAMTDPYEDFAETYNYYILHGDHFRDMISKNSKLKAKYIFMRDRVF